MGAGLTVPVPSVGAGDIGAVRMFATSLNTPAAARTKGQLEVIHPGTPGKATALSPKARIADATAIPAVQ